MAHYPKGLVANLNPDFRPLPNRISLPIQQSIFPSGEEYIRFTDLINIPHFTSVVLTSRCRSNGDVIRILQAHNALKHLNPNFQFELVIPYMPGGRQDRVCVAGEAFGLETYAKLFNQLFTNVWVMDPHSPVTCQLLDSPQQISMIDFYRDIVNDLGEEFTVVCPDKGAAIKFPATIALLESLHWRGGVVYGSKLRDPATGELTGFAVDRPAKNEGCVIIDDICDGGGTFLGLAACLPEVASLHLAVTHGIFSKGFNSLKKVFAGVFTTDSFFDQPSDNFVKVTRIVMNI